MDSEAPRSRLLAALSLMAVGFVAVELWLGLRFGRAPWPTVLSGLWAGSCFIVAGGVAWRLRPRSAIGQWMIVLGFVLLLEVLNTGLQLPSEFPGRGLTVLVGLPAYWLALAIAGRLFLTYPTGTLSGCLERRVVSAGFIVAGVGSLLLLLTKTPVPACADWCGPSPVALVQDAQLYLGTRSAVMVTWVGLAVVVLVLLFRRAKQSPRRQRRIMGFTIGVATLTVVIYVAAELNTLALYSGGGDPGVVLFLDVATRLLVVAALPITLLVGLLRERLEFASVGDLVRRLEHVGAGTVEAALRETLRDPTLRVVFPFDGGWLDVSGASYEPTKHHTVTRLAGDPPIAALVHDPGLTEQPELLAAAGAAVQLALDNARLHAQVRAQLAEVRASRQRIAATADSERQRLERDLHDGAQQRLLGIGLALGMLRGRMADTDDRAVVALLEEELRAVIRELRDLAHGIRPAVLTDQGLMPALAGLARRAAVPVKIDVRLTGRPAPIVESTVYYFVSEALQNIVKHAGATTARVRVAHEADTLTIEVSDDGCGGALSQAGTGLRGLADRVNAVGGRFAIDSPEGTGTSLRATVPCSAGQLRQHGSAQ